MIKIVILSFFLVSLPFSGMAQPDTLTIEELLLILPDSAFHYSHRLVPKGHSFDQNQRLKITQQPDSAIYQFSHKDDSSHYAWLHGTSEYDLYLQFWKKKKHSIVIAVLEDHCDFVMCFQKSSFWEYDGHRFQRLNLNLDDTPLFHYFASEDLKKCGFPTDKGCDDYFLVLEENHLKVKFQQEYIDRELMGDDGEYVCLDLEKSKIFSQEVRYEWTGKKFKLKILKTDQEP